MCPSAADDPLGSSRCPMMTVWQPLWIRCVQYNCCRARSCGGGERSKVSTPAVRCWLNGAFISLSDPDLSAGHQERRPERWDAEPVARSHSVQPCQEQCHLFLHVSDLFNGGEILKIWTICINPQQTDVEGVQLNWNLAAEARIYTNMIYIFHTQCWGLHLHTSSFPAKLDFFFNIYTIYPECICIGEWTCVVKCKIAGLHNATEQILYILTHCFVTVH